MCGSCWAFGAVDTFTSTIAIEEDSDPVELSPQYLVDCGPSFSSDIWGCEGAIPGPSTFDFLKQKGTVKEIDYPYLGKNSYCKNREQTFKIKDYKDINGTPEDFIKELEQAPLFMFIQA